MRPFRPDTGGLPSLTRAARRMSSPAAEGQPGRRGIRDRRSPRLASGPVEQAARTRGAPGGVTWDPLRAAAARQRPGLRPPLPAGPGCCAVCRGPAQAGFLRCFQCAQHRQGAAGLLADLVVPVSYAVAGTPYQRALWRYKSGVPEQEAARAALRAMLLVFLRDHGSCVRARAGMTAFSHVAVVPSGRGRPGMHPLRTLVEPYLALPWADLVIRPGEPVPSRDSAPGPVPGSRAAVRRGRPAARRHLDIGFQRPVGRRRRQAGRSQAGRGRDPRPACEPARSRRGPDRRGTRRAFLPSRPVRRAPGRGSRRRFPVSRRRPATRPGRRPPDHQRSSTAMSSPSRPMVASGSASAKAGTSLFGMSTVRSPAWCAPCTSSNGRSPT